MTIFFLTRPQYDTLLNIVEWYRSDIQRAYAKSEPKWSLAGVTIKTANLKLIQLLQTVIGKDS